MVPINNFFAIFNKFTRNIRISHLTVNCIFTAHYPFFIQFITSLVYFKNRNIFPRLNSTATFIITCYICCINCKPSFEKSKCEKLDFFYQFTLQPFMILFVATERWCLVIRVMQVLLVLLFISYYFKTFSADFLPLLV